MSGEIRLEEELNARIFLVGLDRSCLRRKIYLTTTLSLSSKVGIITRAIESRSINKAELPIVIAWGEAALMDLRKFGDEILRAKSDGRAIGELNLGTGAR